jgi:protein ImuB
MTKYSELYACLYATEFPAQALLRLRQDLRDKPFLVMEGDPPLQLVCALNRKASKLGVARGMTRVEVDAFPSAELLSRSMKEEAAAKAILLECAGGFSPRVEDRSENCAFLCVIDIAGTEKLFGPAEVLARALLNQARTLGITGCVTVSSNFHSSVSLAKGLSPSSIKIVPPGEEAAALALLPLTVLGLTTEQAETFSLWGISTLQMLADLPEKELIARMGQDGKRLRQLARGEGPHLFQPVEPAFTLEERMELDCPVDLLDSLLFVVAVMLDQLILRAKTRILALASVTITLLLERGQTHIRAIRPTLPINDKQFWIKLLHLDLEAHPPRAAILSITLAAEPGSTSKIQLGLFSPQLPEPKRLDVTLARIRSIVGEDCVGRAVLKDTHRPDGFYIEPFTVPAGFVSAVAPGQPRSALRQLRPAENVSVTTQDKRPKAFVFRERYYIVEHIYGPWLTGGDWWNPTLWGLEQWDLVARARDNVLLYCCMVRDHRQDCWQVAALYD